LSIDDHFDCTNYDNNNNDNNNNNDDNNNKNDDNNNNNNNNNNNDDNNNDYNSNDSNNNNADDYYNDTYGSHLDGNTVYNLNTTIDNGTSAQRCLSRTAESHISAGQKSWLCRLFGVHKRICRMAANVPRTILF
jgi:hypothetical protein